METAKNTKNKEDKKIKSLAKALGVKSAFSLGDDKILITSFGKGNDAIIEKAIEKEEVIDKNNPVMFNASKPYVANKSNYESINKKIDITDARRAVKISEAEYKNATVIDVPNAHNMLYSKSEIEKIFFKDEYKDNIHIQIAYNIFDIKKIFTVYSNQIIYTINNMNPSNNNQGPESGNNIDFLGFEFKSQNNYEASCLAYNLCEDKIITFENNNDDGKKQNDNIVFNLDVWMEKINDDSNKKYKSLIKKIEINNRKLNNEYDIKFILSYCFFNIRYTKKIYDAHKRFLNFCKQADKLKIYFPNLFDEKDKKGQKIFSEERAYEVFRILSYMRQESFHYVKDKSSDNTKNKVNNDVDTNNSQNSWLYNIDAKDKSTKKAIESIFNDKFEEFNDKFVNKSKVNLVILKEIYPYKDINDLIAEYYNFAALKKNKNLGFSIKSLREIILTFDDAAFINNSKYDKTRAKIYSLFDFVLYDYFNQHNDIVKNLVANLRTSSTENYKNNIYLETAKKVWNDGIKNIVINKLLPYFESEDSYKAISSKELPTGIKQSFTIPDVSLFSKTMYLISMFLDGKEINMFLNALINKFENIASLMSVLKDNDIEINVKKEYKIFNDSQAIADELKVVKSIAYMSKSNTSLKKDKKNRKPSEVQYIDSAALFGEYDTDKVKQLYNLDTKDKKADKSLRNFMINNVIKSNKFAYVVRYIKASDAQYIMTNKSLVKHILLGIDVKQLIKYCKPAEIVYNAMSPDVNEITDNLSDLLVKINFNSLKSGNFDTEKEKLKSIVRLYLTVLYLAVKSIVRINTTYTVALSCFERDLIITNHGKYDNKSNSLAITKEFIENCKLKNSNVKSSYKENVELCTDNMFRLYRNNIVHLNAVSKFPNYVKELTNVESMFDVYHYVLFKLIYKELEGKSWGEDDLKLLNEKRYNGKYSIAESVDKFKTPNRDFIHAINLPFAYNPARYNNLTSKTLFEKGYGK